MAFGRGTRLGGTAFGGNARRWAAVAGVGTVLALLAAPATPTSVIKLGVTLAPQEQPQWCWAACAQMVATFYGHRLSQCQLANERLAAPGGDPQQVCSQFDCCAHGSQEFCCDRGGWPDDSLDAHGVKFNSSTNTNGLTFDELKAEFAAGRPVIFVWKWDKTQQVVNPDGHMLVAAGFKEADGKKKVWVLDPYPTGKGSQGWKLYDDYVSPGGKSAHLRDYTRIMPR